jgi:hypothetical protein
MVVSAETPCLHTRVLVNLRRRTAEEIGLP